MEEIRFYDCERNLSMLCAVSHFLFVFLVLWCLEVTTRVLVSRPERILRGTKNRAFQRTFYTKKHGYVNCFLSLFIDISNMDRQWTHIELDDTRDTSQEATTLSTNHHPFGWQQSKQQIILAGNKKKATNYECC